MSNTKYLLLLLLLTYSIMTLGQTTTKNYVLTRTFLSSDTSRYVDQIVYHDQLGRGQQTVLKSSTQSISDIVTHKVFDNYGNETEQWLPVSVASNNGDYVELTSLYKTGAIYKPIGFDDFCR